MVQLTLTQQTVLRPLQSEAIMSTPTVTLRATLTLTRDVGASPQVVNDNVDHTLIPNAGFTLRQEILLAAGAVNTAVTLAANTAALILEEVSGAEGGFILRIGSTGATAIRTRRFITWPPEIEAVGIATGVALYLSNDGPNQIRIALSTLNTGT